MKSELVAVHKKLDGIVVEQRHINEKIERVEYGMKALSSDIQKVFGIMEIFADLFDRKENCDLAKRVENIKNGSIRTS